MTTEQAEISRGRSFSGIWIIPLIALLLGVYMVVHTWLTEGPTITIAFNNASGLAEGKTKIKYRSVDMGVVEEVRLNDEFNGVIATIKLDRQSLPLLRDDTRFWVVTAQVGIGNITGLDTLLSGAYIQLAPGTGKEGQRKFVALEKQPLTPMGAPGLRIQLTSEHTSSVGAGDKVLYKGYQVGRVETMEFSPADRRMHYKVFIDAPYHELVNSAVRFWDVSGISLSAGADGFKVDTASMDTILLGGVTFGVPEGIESGDAVKHDTEFKLFTSYEDTLKNPYKYGTNYIVSFDQSIKGLSAGAPVEFRGIPIGRVERVLFKEGIVQGIKAGSSGKGGPIPILIYLEPGRLELPDRQASVEKLQATIRTGVGNGMRASLESGNILTGAKYVSIDYFQDVEEATLGMFMEYTTIPTIETGLGQLEQKLNAVLDTINALPLDDTVTNANAAIATLNETLAGLHTIMASQSTQQLPVELSTTLQRLQSTLDGLSPNSEAYQSINSSLLRLNRTMGNLESLTRTLSGQPNAAVMPSNPTPDPIPEPRQQ